jgi:hypothetical protein
MSQTLLFLSSVISNFSAVDNASARAAIPRPSVKCTVMGVTVELQNLRDAQLCREIAANIKHVLSEKSGEWRVSIAGSRAAQNWDMRVEGPNGFERSYTLSAEAGVSCEEKLIQTRPNDSTEVLFLHAERWHGVARARPT